jgi:hypothetical protein
MKITSTLLGILTAIIALGFVGLLIYINADSPHETKTIGAMVFPTVLTLILTVISYKTLKKHTV